MHNQNIQLAAIALSNVYQLQRSLVDIEMTVRAEARRFRDFCEREGFPVRRAINPKLERFIRALSDNNQSITFSFQMRFNEAVNEIDMPNNLFKEAQRLVQTRKNANRLTRKIGYLVEQSLSDSQYLLHNLCNPAFDHNNAYAPNGIVRDLGAEARIDNELGSSVYNWVANRNCQGRY